MTYHIQTEEEILERIRRYVEIETPGRDPAQISVINEVMIRELEELGARVETVEFPFGDALLATVGDGQDMSLEKVLMLGHRDTVFPMGELKENPFRIEEKDGRRVMRGPGVLDMKAGDAMILEILRHFAKERPEGWEVTALFTGDEEFGSPNSRELIRKEASGADLCLVMEPCIEGMCTIVRKGIYSYVLRAEGISAHSGVNYEKGASAIQALAEVITRVYALRDDEKKISINIGSMAAEGKNNVVCPRAEARGEVRGFQKVLMEETLQKMREICETEAVPGTKVTLEVLGGRPPMEQSEESKKLHELAKNCARRHGLKLEGRIHGGGSDGAFAAEVGTPVLDGMGAEGDGAHTRGEFALVDSLMDRIRTSIDVITEFTRRK